MLYTIGNQKDYTETMARLGKIFKFGKIAPIPGDEIWKDGYDGGCVFQTAADAQRYIEQENGVGFYGIFGLDLEASTWGTATEPSAEGWWHHLIQPADVLVLDPATMLACNHPVNELYTLPGYEGFCHQCGQIFPLKKQETG